MISQFEIFESIEVPGSVWAHVSGHSDTRCPCAHDATQTDRLFFVFVFFWPSTPRVQARIYGDIPGGHPFNAESIYIFTLSAGDDIKITVVSEFIDNKPPPPQSTPEPAAAAPAEQ